MWHEFASSQKQINLCRKLLARGGSKPDCGDDGKPLFETSMRQADIYIKANIHLMTRINPMNHIKGTAGDWGIPNH